MRLKSDGNCPYLDESRLCEVHKRLGSEALSHTCSTYPRENHQYKTEQFNTLTLSCPEVTRLVLFNPHAFTLHEETVYQKQYFNNRKMNTEGQFIHYYCNQIVAMPNDNFEENIYAVHVFIHCCKSIDSTVDDKPQMIFELYKTIRSKLAAGDILKEVVAIPFNANARWHFLIMYQEYTVGTMNFRGHKTLFNYMAFLIHHLMNEVDINQLEERMAMLSTTWNDRVMPLLNQHPHILRNFF
ncbi:flagellin lysine-N-methylase, partial [Yersinia sp. 2544 StPb PI]|uniref:flagellin lysine-N-methylase n=1 Tax=Yersinia sp. 2544 StPb PI TaxID=3117409 RepID=UPI003B28140D